MELFSIKNFMGYGIFVGVEPSRVSDKLIDTMNHQHDRELWILRRLHVVISKETARTITSA